MIIYLRRLRYRDTRLHFVYYANYFQLLVHQVEVWFPFLMICVYGSSFENEIQNKMYFLCKCFLSYFIHIRNVFCSYLRLTFVIDHICVYILISCSKKAVWYVPVCMSLQHWFVIIIFIIYGSYLNITLYANHLETLRLTVSRYI